MNIFFRELKSNRKSLIFWSLGIFFMVVAGMSKYEALSASGESIGEIWKQMPKSLQALMGTGSLDISTVIGYYGVLFLFVVIMASIHASMLGATIISKEERDKTSEFLMVKPVSRERVVTAKLFAALFNIIVLNLLTLVTSVGIINFYSKGQEQVDYVFTLVAGMLAVQVVFLSIGMGIAATSKNPKTAPSAATFIILITYIISAVIDLNPKLENLKYLTPFKYFEAKNLLTGTGVEAVFVVLSAVLILVFTCMTYIFYKKRDLNV